MLELSDGQRFEALLSEQTPEALLAALHACARAAGFDHVSYLAGIPGESTNGSGNRSVQEICHFSTSSDDWLRVLFTENSPEEDYDIQRFLLGFCAPFVSGQNILRLMTPVSAEHRRLLAVKAHFGFSANFLIPLPSTPYSEMCYAAIMFTSAMDEGAFQSSMKRSSHLLLAASHLLHHRLGADAHAFLASGFPAARRVIRAAKMVQPIESVLTGRQREIIEALARGERAPGIAHKLGLSKVTVDRHVKAARDALGAGTTAEAVAKAVARNLIRP